MQVILKFPQWPAWPRIVLPKFTANSPLRTQSREKRKRGKGNTEGKYFLKASGGLAINSYQLTSLETQYGA